MSAAITNKEAFEESFLYDSMSKEDKTRKPSEKEKSQIGRILANAAKVIGYIPVVGTISYIALSIFGVLGNKDNNTSWKEAIHRERFMYLRTALSVFPPLLIVVDATAAIWHAVEKKRSQAPA
ncbi:hypothetical protein PHSC3_000456 [Chlamydiales bacterium STE3]|nr:hypothetical protein PHSC3_000456 [Chlamydiales bacterium STE3]